ncbi:MAG: hypothetical protein J6X60_13160 [Ruminiclostridium sp.]|nr:hypothetical protein [Ruminiclostridium sp.]
MTAPDGNYIFPGRTATAEELRECIRSFCDYSLYSAERELAEGKITLKGGHRAGFTGTAVVKNGSVTMINDISSINLRIASEYKGIAERLVRLTTAGNDMRGLIILGPPLSAKTTMLRDYARILSGFARTSVIDETGEIAAVYRGVPQNDVGMNCDVLDMYPKRTGIISAVRLMSPEYIICDEIGIEYKELAECAGKGIKLVISAHCGSMAEAADNPAVCSLVNAGAVNYAALLSGGEKIGRIKGLWRVKKSEDIGCCGSCNDLYAGGSRVFIGAETAVRTVKACNYADK